MSEGLEQIARATGMSLEDVSAAVQKMKELAISPDKDGNYHIFPHPNSPMAKALTREPTERELLLAWYQLALYRRSVVVHGTISVFGMFQLARQHGLVETKGVGCDVSGDQS